jgi:hypothetical protein
MHNVELQDLYTSPSIIKVIKPRTMREAGHVERKGDMINSYIVLDRKP